MSDTLTLEIMPYNENYVNQLNDLIFSSSLSEELKVYIMASEERFGEPVLFCLCLDSDQVVGGIGFIESVIDGEVMVEIGTFFVDEAYRRQHVASRLLDKLEAHARSKKAINIKMTTDPQFDAAQSTFERSGYHRTDDALYLIMEKQLN